MAKKTNKTSHVLNLITNGGSGDSGAEQEELKEAPEKKESEQEIKGEDAPEKEASLPAADKEMPVKVVSSGEKRVIVVDESSQNQKIENQILDNLTNHLEEEEKAEEKQNQPEEMAEEKQAQLEEKAEEKQAQPEETAAEKAEEKQSQPEKIYHMLNVMEEILGRKKLEKDMEEYNVCMCSRCRADVLALALTGLPAKYVVVDEGAMAPIIGYYENKFKSNTLAEIIKACMQVRDNPRHQP